MTDRQFIHVPMRDGLKSEEDARRVASAFCVLLDAAQAGVGSVMADGDIGLGLEFAPIVAERGAELEAIFTALVYRVSGFILPKLVAEQAGREWDGESEAREKLREMFPGVEPK
jgi:hypothetical protein